MSTFGTLFRVTTFGESHCKAVGAIIDGCPPGLPLTEEDLQIQLSRRRPGQSNLTTPRDEKDKVTILSGTEFGTSLGTPIGLSVNNLDHRPHDYSETDLYPRPSHADFTYLEKYGVKASSGGGRSSARETIGGVIQTDPATSCTNIILAGRVAAGAIAEKFLSVTHGTEIVAFVSSVGNVYMPLCDPKELDFDDSLLDEAEDSEAIKSYMNKWQEYWKLLDTVTRENVDESEVRCPDLPVSEKMKNRILRAKNGQNSIGGTVTCVIRNPPLGLGEPVFDKLEAKLAQAMMSIPATKTFEIGSGRIGTTMPGSLHNDKFTRLDNGNLGTDTNFSGGVQGGISNACPIYFTVSFKPPATIGLHQKTSTYDGSPGVLAAKGRHDPCVVPRAVPIVEAMAALVLMDAFMIQESRRGMFEKIPISIRSLIPWKLRAKPPVEDGSALEEGNLAS